MISYVLNTFFFTQKNDLFQNINCTDVEKNLILLDKFVIYNRIEVNLRAMVLNHLVNIQKNHT